MTDGINTDYRLLCPVRVWVRELSPQLLPPQLLMLQHTEYKPVSTTPFHLCAMLLRQCRIA